MQATIPCHPCIFAHIWKCPALPCRPLPHPHHTALIQLHRRGVDGKHLAPPATTPAIRGPGLSPRREWGPASPAAARTLQRPQVAARPASARLGISAHWQPRPCNACNVVKLAPLSARGPSVVRSTIQHTSETLRAPVQRCAHLITPGIAPRPGAMAAWFARKARRARRGLAKQREARHQSD